LKLVSRTSKRAGRSPDAKSSKLSTAGWSLQRSKNSSVAPISRAFATPHRSVPTFHAVRAGGFRRDLHVGSHHQFDFVGVASDFLSHALDCVEQQEQQQLNVIVEGTKESIVVKSL
jgi:hypothetical protein